jgi:hypothetical protein
VAEQQSGCEWHVRLLTQLLNWPVRHELMLNGRAECCRYVISSQPDLAAEGSSFDYQVPGLIRKDF